MNKIKVIELLNKIANGEELPKKIKWDDMIFTLGIIREVPTLKTANNIDIIEFIRARYLNDEAEIIEDAEEDKGIEKIPKEKIDEYLWEYRGDEVYGLKLFVANILNDKLNEVIDVVNKLNKK